jgi:hypothetical protein
MMSLSAHSMTWARNSGWYRICKTQQSCSKARTQIRIPPLRSAKKAIHAPPMSTVRHTGMAVKSSMAFTLGLPLASSTHCRSSCCLSPAQAHRATGHVLKASRIGSGALCLSRTQVLYSILRRRAATPVSSPGMLAWAGRTRTSSSASATLPSWYLYKGDVAHSTGGQLLG